MLHSEYLEHTNRHFQDRSDDVEFKKTVEHHEKIIGIMRLLNLDRASEILKTLYAPAPRNKPRDPACMLRSLILMTLLKISSIDKWVDETRYTSLYAILCGFEPEDTPGVGTYYDFKKRIIDGPYRKRGKNEIKRSQWNARMHSRNFKSEKEAKKHELNPNHSKSEILVRELLEESDRPREEDFNKILEDLLFQVGIIPSIESGLLNEIEKTIVSGDGSIMATAASADGKPECSCRKQGIYKCNHNRLYSSPTAEWCHNHRTDSFIFGDRYYHLIVTINGHDFPLITLMPGGNESDYTLSLKAIDRFTKAAVENRVDMNIHSFCGDGHHDSNAHYRYLLKKGIVPIIPLSKNSKAISPHLPDKNELRLDEDGTPLCPQNARMRRHQYDRKQKKHVFCCPAKRGTHKNGKAVYVFRQDQCPLKKDCKPKSSLGPFVYIKSEEDPRLFPPLNRDSKLFREIAKQRSASERINFINDSYKLEKTCRNADYGLIRLTIANIAHHASVRYAEAKKSGTAFDVFLFQKNEAVPDVMASVAQCA
jgi:hypothetical protein